VLRFAHRLLRGSDDTVRQTVGFKRFAAGNDAGRLFDATLYVLPNAVSLFFVHVRKVLIRMTQVKR
jgi:hypothetical protein